MERVDRRQLFRLAPKHALSVVGALIIPGLTTGCESVDQARSRQLKTLEQRGMLGEHPLLDLSTVRGLRIEGQEGGGNFLGFSTSTIEGHETTIVHFVWKTNNPEKLVVITDLPANKVVFRVEDDLGVPTVSFQLNERVMVLESRNMVGTVDYGNPQDYLASKWLDCAIIKLSPGDFQKLPTTQNR